MTKLLRLWHPDPFFYKRPWRHGIMGRGRHNATRYRQRMSDSYPAYGTRSLHDTEMAMENQHVMFMDNSWIIQRTEWPCYNGELLNYS